MKKNSDERNKKIRHPAKRKVNNKNSAKRPHIISAFYSNKMQDIVRFESYRENIVGKIVELSSVVDEYYTQSEEVPIMVYDTDGNLTSWTHTSDLLVYCQELTPCLFQIKSEQIKKRPEKNVEHINLACCDYAQKKGWEYRVIYPFELDVILRKNIDLLFSFRNNSNEGVSNIIISTLKEVGELSIEALVRECDSKVERLILLPVIYFELAVGNLFTDMFKPITLKSVVRLKQESDYDLYDYILELHNFSNNPRRVVCSEN